jgi:cell division protein FtsI (penicillin-binding protein 3)
VSKFDNKKVLPRYLAIAVVLSIVCIAIVAKAGYTMTAKKEYWDTVAAKMKQDSISVKPTRGNILSCDGQLMASSIPEYKLFIDFQPGKQRGVELDSITRHRLDTLWEKNIDSLCVGLHSIFPERSAEEFKQHLLKGKSTIVKDEKFHEVSVGARHWAIWPRRIDYATYKEVAKLPILCLPVNKGGFHTEKNPNARRRPFGSLAQRTVGTMFGDIDSAKCGLELSFDSVLRGTNGISHQQKVRNKFVKVTVAPPVNGCDIVTTIDVGMQDMAERALVEELKKDNASMGVAILMEVKTGDVKAIVNMTKCDDGEYHETVNHAVSYRCEPGSVFKTASFLVALDDGVIPGDSSYVIHTGSGIMQMYGSNMKDHNWYKGGYGDINVARALEVSSNIGVSYVIDKFYHDHPSDYVKGLYRVGIGQDLDLDIKGYAPPKIRMPNTKTTNKAEYWSKTTLPWMSIGYETQIAPINTLAFYNAIANDGKLLRPRFVKQFVKDGVVIRETKPEVINKQIAKPQTVKMMQTILEHVVSQGLGRKAGSRSFKVAGKTGTAQVSQGGAGYKSGQMWYWLSFVGFFPADNPRYSCIVCLKKPGLPASGGGMAGVVFHHISEGVMARYLKSRVEDACDENSVLVPEVKDGNMLAADYVLKQLDIDVRGGWGGSYADEAPIWGKALTAQDGVQLSEQRVSSHVMPDVTGMGARDAIYMLESRGIKVKINGVGRVKSQSIPSGRGIEDGMQCELVLGNI